jgi:predicted component of type VI protein secretion system
MKDADMADDFDDLTDAQKIERLRGALAAFAQSLRAQGDKITSLSARYNVLRGAFEVVLTKLAKGSGNPERFVMDIEKVMETVGDNLATREDTAVVGAYRAEVKEMFAALRKAADPEGSRTKKPH